MVSSFRIRERIKKRYYLGKQRRQIYKIHYREELAKARSIRMRQLARKRAINKFKLKHIPKFYTKTRRKIYAKRKKRSTR